MLLQDVTTERLDLALKPHLEASPLQAKIEATNARKKRGDGVRQNFNP